MLRFVLLLRVLELFLSEQARCCSVLSLVLAALGLILQFKRAISLTDQVLSLFFCERWFVYVLYWMLQLKGLFCLSHLAHYLVFISAQSSRLVYSLQHNQGPIRLISLIRRQMRRKKILLISENLHEKLICYLSNQAFLLKHHPIPSFSVCSH